MPEQYIRLTKDGPVTVTADWLDGAIERKCVV
jgi:hypothetical protein